MHAKENPVPGGNRGGDMQNISSPYYTRPSELLIPRLNRVVPRGPGQWSASCPTAAHPLGDRSRGLSIRETQHGVLLLKCFAGCSADEIVGAVGLELADLFPRSPADDRGDCRKLRGKPRVNLRAAFESLETDLLACSLAFHDLAKGLPFTPIDAAFIAMSAAHLASVLAEVRHGGI